MYIGLCPRESRTCPYLTSRYVAKYDNIFDNPNLVADGFIWLGFCMHIIYR